MGVHVSIASGDDKISLPLKMKVSMASKEARYSRFPALSAGCKAFFALCYIWAKFHICKYEMWLWHKGDVRENIYTKATTTGIPLNNIHLANNSYITGRREK